MTINENDREIMTTEFVLGITPLDQAGLSNPDAALAEDETDEAKKGSTHVVQQG